MTVATVTPNINAIVDQGQNMRVIKEDFCIVRYKVVYSP